MAADTRVRRPFTQLLNDLAAEHARWQSEVANLVTAEAQLRAIATRLATQCRLLQGACTADAAAGGGHLAPLDIDALLATAPPTPPLGFILATGAPPQRVPPVMHRGHHAERTECDTEAALDAEVSLPGHASGPLGLAPQRPQPCWNIAVQEEQDDGQRGVRKSAPGSEQQEVEKLLGSQSFSQGQGLGRMSRASKSTTAKVCAKNSLQNLKSVLADHAAGEQVRQSTRFSVGGFSVPRFSVGAARKFHDLAGADQVVHSVNPKELEDEGRGRNSAGLTSSTSQKSEQLKEEGKLLDDKELNFLKNCKLKEEGKKKERELVILTHEDYTGSMEACGMRAKVEYVSENAPGGRNSTFTQVPNVNRTTRQQQVLKLVNSQAFDSFIGVIIACNSITIGLESAWALEARYVGEDQRDAARWIFLDCVEYICRTIFVVEIGVRIYSYGGLMTSLKSSWMRFDALIVGAGCADWAMKFIWFVAGIEADFNVTQGLLMIRIIRLARLARTFRLMIQFKTLWLLCQGLLHSLMSLVWTFVLLSIICYIYSILGMEMIAGQHLESEVVQANFGGMAKCFLTLLRILTFDGWTDIWRAVALEQFAFGWWALITAYFMSFMLIASIALMNLVTAIMVESSIQRAKEDREAQGSWELSKKRALIPKLQQMFMTFDADGSGEIDLDEIASAPADLKAQLAQIVQIDSIEELFRLLDYDNDGSLGIDEFLEGVIKAQGDKPLEFTCIIRQCAAIRKDTHEILGHYGESGDSENEDEAPPKISKSNLMWDLMPVTSDGGRMSRPSSFRP